MSVCIFREDNTLARRTKWGDLLPVHLSPREAPLDFPLDDKENSEAS